MIEIENRIETWSLAVPFRITDQVFHEIEVVVTIVRDGGLEGRGEAAGVDYLGETPASIIKQIEGVKDALREPDRAMLQCLLPPGGARNALDCAFWELEAARSGQPAWRLAGLTAIEPRVTTYTIGAAAPAIMAERAVAFSGARALKLKLIGDGEDAERVAAVRAARPDVWLGVDANQGFSTSSLEQLMPDFLRARVALIEQPLPVDLDWQLESFISPIPLAADESVQGMASLERLPKAFSVINIKLDKCGGLTEALAMARAARGLGFKVMVGNMLGTSLAMAPAFLVGQLCEIVDLDGPVLLQHDRDPGALYRDGEIWCSNEVWGAGEARHGSAAFGTA